MPVLVEKPLPEMTEIIEAWTSVQRAYASEYRTSLRGTPRHMVSLSFRLPDDRWQVLYDTLRASLHADWTVPQWHERTRNLDLSAGQTSITCNTEADYRVGGLAIVWKGCAEYETVTVADVGPTSITVSALSASYTDAAVMPANPYFIMGEVATSRANRGLIGCTIPFQARAASDLAASPWGTFQTYDILGCASGYLSPLQGMIRPVVEYVDNGAGPVVLEPQRSTDDDLQAVEVSGHAWKVKQFLHRVRGPDRPFWVKEWGGALDVQAALAGATTIIVAKTRAAANLVGRRVVVAGEYFEILGAVDGGATVSLNLDGPLGANIPAGAPCGLLRLVRLDADEVQIAHKHGFAARTQFPVMVV